MTDFNLYTRPKKQSFHVPEGYFDTLTNEVMGRIPSDKSDIKPLHSIEISHGSTQQNASKKDVTFAHSWRWVAATAAACMIAFFSLQHFGIHTEKHKTPNDTSTAHVSHSQTNTQSDDYQSDILEYAMVDQNDIYNYLSGSEL